MNRRTFLKCVTAAVVAPVALKGVAAPAASTGVTFEQCMELGAATLKDLPPGTLVVAPDQHLKWVNYYASYDYDMTELDREKIREEIRKETDTFKRCAPKDSGVDRCDEVACNHLSVGEQRVQDARRQESFLEDCYPDGPAFH